ncbi:MAG TPA: MATE family efflux transporter [Polyangiaceae bacterium]|nr:MATE family efflux transporter [Polyangiaceae bacterium]
MTTRRDLLRMAWPFILANATAPLLGLADTAVIGNTGTVLDLGGIALGALIFNFLFWSFGFLRMGTTGFVAQAAGNGDEAEVRAVLGRALLLGGFLGLALIALAGPLDGLFMELFHGSPDVERVASSYVQVRIWSAPAYLAGQALRGCLIGLGHSRGLLLLELALNTLNVLLDLLFAGVLGWGAVGVGIGTALAEWLALVYAFVIVVQRLRQRRNDSQPFWSWARIGQRSALREMLRANGDIMLRTLLLVFGFAWFNDQSARFGDTLLAANHVLLQFISFSAFFLDGFAYVAETLVGNAVGARRRADFDRAVQRTSEVAALSAVGLAAALAFGGSFAIALLTDLEPVRAAARVHLPFAAGYVLVAVAAFQLDGVFIGATRTRAMRNAAVLSTGWFVVATHFLARDSAGLWLAFLTFAVARAAALGLYYPSLRRSIPGVEAEPSSAA